ncbi:MAG: hypothetical protein EHM47_11490 [Ignavibacteriales bacterium]|nr:MAG: hypothetical protein EHM47_11490 [Ignavibacteriales bacterium]
MKNEQDYIQDIAEIRTMMERSSKFLSLSGWAGIMAGIYALFGAYISYSIFNFNPDAIVYSNINSGTGPDSLLKVIILGLLILILALVTAIIFSWKKAHNRGEKIWNATSRRLLASMAVPLVTGGILILVLITKDIFGLVIPLMLLFYGLALYNASKFTINEVKFLGMTQIVLGLISSYFIEYSLLFWSIGFGVVHIVYGIYMYFRYER